MSQENAEIARKPILDWNEHGVESIVEVCDPDVEYHAPAGLWELAMTSVGALP